MTAADPALIEGASVGELLQQVEDQFYLLAVQPPSARALLSAWPDFAKASANLLRAVIGPSADDHSGAQRNPDVHPAIPTAVRLMHHLDQLPPSWTRAVPDPAILRSSITTASIRAPSGGTRSRRVPGSGRAKEKPAVRSWTAGLE